MRKALHRRPSASMVVSLVALVVAMSGSAVAATKLLSGDKLIKKGTLSGNRLRNRTLTGTQINLKKLGKVPSAKQADAATHANTAGSATTATNATNAGTAANANALGGVAPSGYLAAASRIGTRGIVTAAGTASGATVTLFSTGPFTVTMTCTTSGAGTALTVDATSTQGNSDLNDTIQAAANTSTDLGNPDVTATTTFQASNDDTVDFEAPSGAEAIVSGTDGVNWPATNDCFANLAGIA